MSRHVYLMFVVAAIVVGFVASAQAEVILPIGSTESSYYVLQSAQQLYDDQKDPPSMVRPTPDDPSTWYIARDYCTGWLATGIVSEQWAWFDLGAPKDLAKIDIWSTFQVGEYPSGTWDQSVRELKVWESDALQGSVTDLTGTITLTPQPTSFPIYYEQFDLAGAMDVRYVKLQIISNYGNASYVLLGGICFEPIPEPGTLALLATGLMGLLCYAWRKRK